MNKLNKLTIVFSVLAIQGISAYAGPLGEATRKYKAAQTEYKKVSANVIKNAWKNYRKDYASHSAVMSALLSSDSEKVQSILQEEAKKGTVNQAQLDRVAKMGNARGWTPLALAAAKGDHASVKALLKHGASVGKEIELKHQDGKKTISRTYSPVALAAMHRKIEVIHSLLDPKRTGPNDYVREMNIATRLGENSLGGHLRDAANAQAISKMFEEELRGKEEPEKGSLEFQKRNYLGDLKAQAQEGVCYCQFIPGNTGSFQLLNGLWSTGGVVWSACCRNKMCLECSRELLSRHDHYNPPKCPQCRTEYNGKNNPLREQYSYSIIDEPIWFGKVVPVPSVSDKKNGSGKNGQSSNAIGAGAGAGGYDSE